MLIVVAIVASVWIHTNTQCENDFNAWLEDDDSKSNSHLIYSSDFQYFSKVDDDLISRKKRTLIITIRSILIKMNNVWKICVKE